MKGKRYRYTTEDKIRMLRAAVRRACAILP
jgi:hypothetical protein